MRDVSSASYLLSPLAEPCKHCHLAQTSYNVPRFGLLHVVTTTIVALLGIPQPKTVLPAEMYLQKTGMNAVVAEKYACSFCKSRLVWKSFIAFCLASNCLQTYNNFGLRIFFLFSMLCLGMEENMVKEYSKLHNYFKSC